MMRDTFGGATRDPGMGRGARPPGTRDGMKRLLILTLCVQLGACAHAAVGVSTSTATTGAVATGTTAVGGQVAVASSGAGAIALFAVAAAMMTASEMSASGTTTYNANPFAAIDGSSSSRRQPELDAGRRVHEQDCTKPIADWSANLKCR